MHQGEDFSHVFQLIFLQTREEISVNISCIHQMSSPHIAIKVASVNARRLTLTKSGNCCDALDLPTALFPLSVDESRNLSLILDSSPAKDGAEEEAARGVEEKTTR